MEFQDKSIVITGAAGVFGRWITERFAREGARLCLSDNRRSLLDKLAASLGLPASRTILHATELEFILQPQTLIRIRHVGELGADVPAVNVLQARDDFAQLGVRRYPVVTARGEKLGVEVSFAQARKIQIQYARPWTL